MYIGGQTSSNLAQLRFSNVFERSFFINYYILLASISLSSNVFVFDHSVWVCFAINCVLLSVTNTSVSYGFPHYEQAHEENHNEKQPHEESIQNLGNLFPLSRSSRRSSLIAVTVCDILDIPHEMLLLTFAVWFESTIMISASFPSSSCGFSYICYPIPAIHAHKHSLLPHAIATGGVNSQRACRAHDLRHVFRVLGKFWRCGILTPLKFEHKVVFPSLPIHVAVGLGWLLRFRVWFLWLRRHAVFTNFVDKANPGQILQDEFLGPVWDGFGLGATVMYVHNKDGEGGGCSDHGHRGYVILSCRM